MDYRAVIVVAILNNACHQNYAKLNVIPRDTEVKINDSTYMNCSTSLRANLIQWLHGKYYVYTGQAFLEPYNDGRFSIEIETSMGTSNLVIRSVQPTDAGKYECLEDEGFGEKGTAELIVLDADPFCTSNVNPDGVIGPNSCDVRAEEIRLSCSIKYHGNVLPILQWKAGRDNEFITDRLFNVTNRNNEVTYSLTIKSDLVINNSSFICQTTRMTRKPYTCSSNTINILYVFSSKLTMNMTLNDEVSCFVNTSQSCNYKWKWFSGEDVSTESDNKVLKPKKVGWHRCEATCSFRNKSCRVESMQAKVYSDAATERQNLMPLLVLLLLPPLVVIGVIMYMYMYRWKKRKIENKELDQGMAEEQTLLAKLTQKYTNPVLIHSIEEASNWITGLAILDNELFVVTKESSEIEVYDSIEFSFSRRMHLNELIDPVDIASCDISKCLYILDMKGFLESDEILRVDSNGTLIKNWSIACSHGYTVSITDESNVIVSDNLCHVLKEYSPDGQLLSEINISVDAALIRHAIKLSNGHFLFSFDSGYKESYGVCIVDAVGKLTRSFVGKCGPKSEQMYIYSQVYMSVDENGFVLVADQLNSQVSLLDSDLTFPREILSREKHGLQCPRRIILDESNGRILVVDELRILIFQIKE